MPSGYPWWTRAYLIITLLHFHICFTPQWPGPISSPVSALEVGPTPSPSVLNQHLTPNSCAVLLCHPVPRAPSLQSHGSRPRVCASAWAWALWSLQMSPLGIWKHRPRWPQQKGQQRKPTLRGALEQAAAQTGGSFSASVSPQAAGLGQTWFRRKMRSTGIIPCFRTSPASTGHLALWGMPSLLLKGQIFPGDRLRAQPE